MYSWEPRVLLRHYLEQGLSKTAIAARVGLGRRTVCRWLAEAKLDGDLDATTVHYPPRRTKLGPYVNRHPKFPRRWHLRVPTLGWG